MQRFLGLLHHMGTAFGCYIKENGSHDKEEYLGSCTCIGVIGTIDDLWVDQDADGRNNGKRNCKVDNDLLNKIGSCHGKQHVIGNVSDGIATGQSRKDQSSDRWWKDQKQSFFYIVQRSNISDRGDDASTYQSGNT